jgi:hypothetical protein
MGVPKTHQDMIWAVAGQATALQLVIAAIIKSHPAPEAIARAAKTIHDEAKIVVPQAVLNSFQEQYFQTTMEAIFPGWSDQTR